MKSVYLAGPITGLNYDNASDWRFRAQEFLAQNGISGMSPMRGKSYLRALGELSSTCIDEERLGVLSSPRAIMTRDFYDCTHCDLVLVNFLGATRVSIGTCLEIAWAFQKRTPVVCCIESNNIHDHAMVNEAIGFRVQTLEEALGICVAVLNPGSMDERNTHAKAKV